MVDDQGHCHSEQHQVRQIRQRTRCQVHKTIRQGLLRQSAGKATQNRGYRGCDSVNMRCYLGSSFVKGVTESVFMQLMKISLINVKVTLLTFFQEILARYFLGM